MGFVIMPRGPGFLRDDDSDRQVEGAARHGAALPSPDASQGLSAQGFSQRRSARGFTAEFTAPSPLQIERQVELQGSATPTLSRSALPQVAAYREMRGSTSRDTSLHPRHQGIAPYGTLEAAASRPGMGFTRTPGEEINHISMGDEKARPSALQAYASIENGSRESNVLQATDTLPSAAQRVRSAAQEGVSPGGSSVRQVLASSELFPGYYRPVRTDTGFSMRGTDSVLHRADSFATNLHRADSFATNPGRDSSLHSTLVDMYVCVCVCVTCIYIYIHIYIYIAHSATASVGRDTHIHIYRERAGGA